MGKDSRLHHKPTDQSRLKLGMFRTVLLGHRTTARQARSAVQEFLLGESGRPRQRVAQTLIALAVYIVYAMIQELEVSFGFIDSRASHLLSIFYLAGALASYLAVRTGLSRRFGKDPSLTLPQLLIGMLSLSWSYAITNATRGVLISMIILILVFGAFSLRPKIAAQIGTLAALMLMCSMAWGHWINPSHHDGKIEIIYLMIALINIAAATVLSTRLGHLTDRLRKQKNELQTALGKIQILANCDELTGLKNRRQMTILLQAEKESIEKSFCVGILDIDHFKRINDTFGHLKGDEVLHAFAMHAEGSLRAEESIGRWGGEEFIVLFRNITLAESMRAMERICELTAATDLAGMGHGTVTVSGGLAQHRSGDTIERTIDRADRALYSAKAAGRNRICMECDP